MGFILFFQSRHLISVCVIIQIFIFQIFPWSFVDHLKKNVELLFSGFYLHFVPLNSASCKIERKNLFISGGLLKHSASSNSFRSADRARCISLGTQENAWGIDPSLRTEGSVNVPSG